MSRIKNAVALIKKNDIYFENKIKAGETMPFGKRAMRLLAICNYLLYGTSFSEFFAYRFYALSRTEKKNYMTRRHMFRFFDRYNPPVFRERIGDKRLTHLYYGEFLNREQFDYSRGFAEFLKFAERHPKIFVKQAVSWGGIGAYIADVSDPEKCKTEWNKLNENCVIEEHIKNCESITRLYPGSLNTIKVLTLWINGKAEIQTALFRMGNNTPVDNVHLGGICALVDIDSGVVCTRAVDNHFQEYVVHPVTGEQIVGFVIPMWNEVKELAKKAASVTPEMRYSSWDIAVTDNGPILIEGNWDAEFYAEQMLMNRGLKNKYCAKLR